MQIEMWIRQIRWIRRFCWFRRIRRVHRIRQIRWVCWIRRVRQVRRIRRIRVRIRRIRVLKIAWIWVTESFEIKERWPMTEKLPGSIKFSKFAFFQARISAESNSRKDSRLTERKWWPQILVKLTFIGLYYWKLSVVNLIATCDKG